MFFREPVEAEAERRRRVLDGWAAAAAASSAPVSSNVAPAPTLFSSSLPAPSAIPASVAPLTSTGIDRMEAMEQRRAPMPQQRRALDARARRPMPRTDRSSLLERLNRPFAPGETITPRQTALLAEAAGLPGRTYSRSIVPGESSYQPGIRNPDDATPSLFQITPSVQSAATQGEFNRIASQHPGGFSNPVAAARQAAFLAGDSADEGVSNYVAYNPSGPQGHLRGGQRRAERILGGPLSSVAGEEAGRAPRQLSTNELFYDPGVNLVDGQETGAIGGHDTHVHYASDRPRDILTAARVAERMGLDVRENPLFETVDPVHAEGSEHYQERPLPEALEGLARRLGGSGDVIGDAIDVPGSPEDLLRFDQALARRSGTFVDSPSGTLTSPTGTSSGGSTGLGGFSADQLGPYAGMVRDQLGQIRQSPVGSRAPMPRAPMPGEEEDDEDTLAAIIEDRFRPQRRIAF